MNHYEEGINAMWEEVEGKKPEPIHQPSDEERWKEFVEEYSHSGYLVQSEFVSFGIREPYDIKKIESYELPSDDDMFMQAVDQMICEACMFNEHCCMGMCIANEEWRERMRKIFFNAAKGNK